MLGGRCSGKKIKVCEIRSTETGDQEKVMFAQRLEEGDEMSQGDIQARALPAEGTARMKFPR